MKANNLAITYDSQGKAILTISLADRINTDKLIKFIDSGKMLDVDIDLYRAKRSKDANSYLWLILQKMADVLGASKDELYIEVLKRYGQSEHMLVMVDAVEAFKREYRAITEVGEKKVNEGIMMHLLCHIGSSNYNSKEMSILLNGVVGDAKELGIETETEEEIKRLTDMIGA